MQYNKMTVIGVTGGLACGKSTVCGMLEEIGVPVINCDTLNKELQLSSAALIAKIEEHFPKVVNEGILDRVKLAELVLGDKEKLKLLEDISMPFILSELSSRLGDCYAKGAKVVAVEAPLLFERDLAWLCNTTVCIYVDDEVARARFLSRPNATIQQYELLTSAQMPIADKKKQSDYVILADTLDNMKQELASMLVCVKSRSMGLDGQELSKTLIR